MHTQQKPQQKPYFMNCQRNVVTQGLWELVSKVVALSQIQSLNSKPSRVETLNVNISVVEPQERASTQNTSML